MVTVIETVPLMLSGYTAYIEVLKFIFSNLKKNLSFIQIVMNKSVFAHQVQNTFSLTYAKT